MAVDWDWSRIVFDHVKIGVCDADASKRFYRTVLEPLSIPPLWERDRGAQFANLVLSADAATMSRRYFVRSSRTQEARPPLRS